MDFLGHWKSWVRPLAMIVYFILMMIAIPLCIIELTKDDPKPPLHVKSWFTGGVFVLIAVPVSLWEILQHLIHYTQPHLQKYIIRIIWMVPIYALNAWFALKFPDAAIYLDTIRECYEAYVIYNFMEYLLTYLWTVHPQLNIVLQRKPQQKHIIPFCCLRPWKMGSKLITYCKHGVLQYTVVRPITTLIAVFCEVGNVYEEGDLNFQSAWSYLVVINNISQIWAMYNLVLFYYATKEELQPVKPLPKFLCVKFVVFFSFWQSVLIAILVKLKAIPVSGTWDFYSIDEVAKGIQDFCICVEMFIAALAHRYAFSHKEFIDDSAEQTNCCRTFWSMWDVSDVKDDVMEHVRVIGTGMKKTVSAPFLGGRRQTEATPLLQVCAGDGDGDPTATSYTGSPQVTQADVHQQQSDYQSVQADNQSTVSDWEVTSIDRWKQPATAMAKSATSSMNNFLDMSTSVEVHSSKSTAEHPRLHSVTGGDTSSAVSDSQSNTDKHSGDTDLISFNAKSGGGVLSSQQSLDDTCRLDHRSSVGSKADVQEGMSREGHDATEGAMEGLVDSEVTDIHQTSSSVTC